MFGAMIGDYVGSRFEFDNYRKKDFELVHEDCFVTDDTIMTLAVGDIIQNKYYLDEDKVIETFKKWGRTYPNYGYGLRFDSWLHSDKKESYNSLGNGSAMRVSLVGWYARNEEEVKELSRIVTKVTHSHPEGLLGAEVTAMCVYYARIGKTKEFIKEYASKYYNLDFDYDDLVKNYEFNELCRNTVPQAIYCFLISTSFEDCLRTSISIGGDSDTLAAISCSIAEAYYKDIDNELINAVINALPESKNGCNIRTIIDKFNEYKNVENAISEDINKDTKILMLRNGIHISFVYSKSLKALGEFIVYEELDKLVGAEDDCLSKEALKEGEIDKYIEVIGYCSLYKSEEYLLLKEMEKDLDSLVNGVNFNEFKRILDKLNSELNKIGISYNFIIYDSPDDCINDFSKEINVKNRVYKEIFDKNYKIMK